MITELILVFDHARQTLTICSNVKTNENSNLAYQNAVDKIKETIDILSEPVSIKPESLELDQNSLPELPEGNFTQNEFHDLVEKCKEYIKSGDVIQTVLSQRFAIPFDGKPVNLYRAIRAINPSPYMFILRMRIIQLSEPHRKFMFDLMRESPDSTNCRHTTKRAK